MNISVLGLGKLGLCTASCFAMKQQNVIGVDKSEFIVNELRNKRCPINETNMEDILNKAWDFLEVTNDIGYAINNSVM